VDLRSHPTNRDHKFAAMFLNSGDQTPNQFADLPTYGRGNIEDPGL